MEKHAQLKRAVILCTLFLAMVPPAWPRTIRVATSGSGVFTTIQAAIDDANDGDTVLVAPGTYTGDGNRDIEFKGKAITVRSEAGPETCIIDCQGSEAENHRGVLLQKHDIDCVFQGFTITNGYISHAIVGGGGISCGGTRTTIRDCIVTNNYARREGGAMVCGGNTEIIDCTVKNNRTEHHIGGAIRLGVGFPKVKGCLIADNVGVGLSIYDLSEASVTNCTIVENHSQGPGGGVYFESGGGMDCVITNTIIWGNTAAVGGDQIGAGWWRAAGRRTSALSSNPVS